jgi:hypothetical protein
MFVIQFVIESISPVSARCGTPIEIPLSELQTKKTNNHEKVNLYPRKPDRNDLR